MDERTTMLKAAVAKCFKARGPVTPANVRKYVPVDFFYDHDAGKQLSDAEVFAEIQATYRAAPPAPAEPPPQVERVSPRATVEANEPVEDFSGDADESLRDTWAPETVREPVVEAAPVVEESTASHEAIGPGLSPQARLDAARKREQALLGERPILQAAQRNAREALAKAVRAYQDGGPKQSHEDLARDFIRASQVEREARARGETWATKPERRTHNGAAFVDVERAYSHGGDANTFARRHNRTGNRRGAYAKQSFGTINRDPSRGPVPAPVVEKQTIPALGK